MEELPILWSVLVCADDDSLSDWSTDSCGWSDDDYGVDVDVTSPPLSLDCGAESNDQEIVRCICEVEEENDFMIQVSIWDSMLARLSRIFLCFHAVLSFSVKTACAGSMARAWACWKTMSQTDTLAIFAETLQVRGGLFDSRGFVVLVVADAVVQLKVWVVN